MITLSYSILTQETTGSEGQAIKEVRTVKFEEATIENIEQEIRKISNMGYDVEVKLTPKDSEEMKEEKKAARKAKKEGY